MQGAAMKDPKGSYPEVKELIPQRPPMVMIDQLISFGEDEAVTELMIRKENIFTHKGLFREAGVLENIAQSAAAWKGFLNRQEGHEVQKGYIGGIKNLEIQALPEIGEVLETRVRVEHRVMGAIVLSADCRSGSRIIALF
jgi:predicted hotdog family 3-hydroxylacyl-ACP dehydratase